ncbi:MAG: hypothetical protein ACOYOB_07580 [Myxococcota bacterium]|jgi:hypothetical protein
MPRFRTLSLLPFALAAVAVLTMAVAAPDAFAQKKSKKASRTMTFEDDVIETTLLRPETENTVVQTGRKRSSLIRIRTNFFAEIIRSAEDL